MKMSDRIAPPGFRSSHHTGGVSYSLGESGSESAAPELVAAAELVLGVGSGLGRLTSSRQRAVAGRLLGGNLGREQTIVDRVLEAAQPALLVLGGIFRGWRIGHLLTLHWLPK